MMEKTLPIAGGHTSPREGAFALGVAIPTYNRAARLSRSLSELRTFIVRQELQDSVSVYVTDNGSTDDTKEVLAEQSIGFARDGISFTYESVEANKGFDHNVRRCFNGGTGRYCWFVSDDDNLEENVLKRILADIAEFEPNLIVYNFDQTPYSKGSPLIKEKKFFVEDKTDHGFRELSLFPKLTALVVKRSGDSLQSEVFNYDGVPSSGFAHTALAMHTAYHYGRILLSNAFCATHDPDHRDHIDFPPYIGNSYNKMVDSLFRHMGQPEWTGMYTIPHTNVGVSALEWLIDYYRGRAVVPYELRLELRRGLKEYVAQRKARLLLHPKFVRRCIYLAVAWSRWFVLERVFRIRVTRQRKSTNVNARPN
jgi:glycosyltransferase involved in cell wall biosynthesis